MLKYALARIAILLAVAGVLYLLGARSWLMWLGALLLAAMVSYAVLPRVRDDAARTLARQDDRSERVDRDADEEDAMLDRAERSRGEDAVTSPAERDDGTGLEDETWPDADAEDGGSSLEHLPEAVEDAPVRVEDERSDVRERD